LGMSVIVTGIRGVGKSTVIAKAVEKVAGVTVMNFGGTMLKLCTERGYATDRDAIRKLPSNIQEEVEEEVWKSFANQDGKVIIDTHVFVEHRGMYLPGLPANSVEKLVGLKGLFFIDIDNKTLRERAAKDKKRLREGHEDHELNDYRYANIAALSYLSTRLNIPLYIIQNKEGMLDQTVDIFIQHLHDAFGDKQ